MTTDPVTATDDFSPEPTERRTPSTSRRRVLVALPLVLALLGPGFVSWTRAEPARQGGFCSRATVQATRILRAASVEVQQDPQLDGIVDTVLEYAYLAQPEKLVAGAPPDLRDDLEAAQRLLPDYRAERKSALRAGQPPPEVPEALRTMFLQFLAVYVRDCV